MINRKKGTLIKEAGFSQRNELRRGLPMVEASDPASLEKERELLREINSRPHFWQRWKGYWGLSGPGWVQSALTLGAGSAGSAIFAGAVYGYKLLWVQPAAMFLGVMMFAGIGHQLLVTRARPYDVFWKKLHPSLALLWGFNVFLASVVWQFPQYSLGTAVFKDIFNVFGINMPKGIIALILLIFGTGVCWSYERGSRKAIRAFEQILKYMLLLMIVSFLLVVIKTGVNWAKLLKGFFCFHIPQSREGITIVLGQLGAAVGVNMTFLYPYTMLANIGILGAFYAMPLWLPVITSSFNLLMMPVAYICFFVLQNKKSYLEDEVNQGIRGAAWNIILILAIMVVAAGAVIKILSVLGFWQ